jgi:hypothetical protein
MHVFIMRLRDFSFILDPEERLRIKNGCETLDKLDLWSWLSEYIPEDGLGYSLSSHPNMYKIGKCMETLTNPPRHSGFSFTYTMRHLRFIAKFGLTKYKECVIDRVWI